MSRTGMVLLRCIGFILFIIDVKSIYAKECFGTNGGVGTLGPHSETPEADQERYNMYEQRYINCTYVDGNLELVNIKRIKFKSNSFEFLQSIQEVTGYVLIFNVWATKIPLINLRIIRGHKLFRPLHEVNTTQDRALHNMALYVAMNAETPPENVSIGKGKQLGLKELQLPSLTEISAGNVVFSDNYQLCYENTTDWNDIISETYENRSDTSIHVANNTSCGSCHRSCSTKDVNNTARSHCWGEGKKMCQRLTRTICSGHCTGRCYERGDHCCNVQCAGGCTGPENTNCLACRNYNDSGVCRESCPTDQEFDMKKQKWIDRKPKFIYLGQCVEKCPRHLVVEDFACAVDCKSERRHGVDGVCTDCEGLCPRRCEGTSDDMSANNFVNSKNIDRFRNCSVVQGSLRILQSTLKGDPAYDVPAMTVDKLYALSKIEEITDYLRIDSPHITNLSFLNNLRKIHGRKLGNGVNAIVIVQTDLERLDLHSLTEVVHGTIIVSGNKKLCFGNTPAFWNRLHLNHSDPKNVVDVSSNGDKAGCQDRGLRCSARCTDDGCVGPDPDQCAACREFSHGRVCVQSCEELHARPRLYADSEKRVCQPCHVFCDGTCTGPGSHECHKCANARLSGHCVLWCPITMYLDAMSRDCLNCSDYCAPEAGCTGPSDVVGPGGCISCDVAEGIGDVNRCLPIGSHCAPGRYMNSALYTDENKILKKGCALCHDDCRTTCQADGNMYCTYCVDEQNCSACHHECIGCEGPSAGDCFRCRNLIVYEDFLNREHSSKFNCTSECPDWAPNKVTINRETICVEDRFARDNRKQTAIISGSIVGGLALIGMIVVCVLLLRRQLAKVEENKLRLTAKINGIVECEPLTPGSSKPDMAVLRLIKESDLRRGAVIGSGAFGTVYKGMWVPAGENVKIPVAIKVLQEGTTAGENRNMLEEARIMASVVHPCCVNVLAVCLTAQMMLVTQLMPLGCLLEYVRKNKTNIGSKSLLNWCTQIARGMVYLESRGIIHRDLAARNVLGNYKLLIYHIDLFIVTDTRPIRVQSATHIKITDFGLAKLVDEDGQFYSATGKVPIKWLALECIRQRIYTHKSDVWSYGVTVWELFTYGQRPYETVSAKDVPELLEKGERLSQPSVCTIDVYMIMIKCWMLDADIRPTFTELEAEFAKMARDPGRYLVVPNDLLMRLPSQPNDPKEFLRHISLAHEGPEEVVLADEYVNEMTRRQSNQHPLNCSDNLITESSRSLSDNHTDNGRPTSRSARNRSNNNKHQPISLDLKSSIRNISSSDISWAQNTSQHGDGNDSPRYSPDPALLAYPPEFPASLSSAYLEPTSMGKRTVSVDEVELVPNLISRLDTTRMNEGERGVDAGEVRLPLDETDYLQPKSAAPTSYLDLVDDYTSERESDYHPQNHTTCEDRDKVANERTSLLASLDNPEYFSTKSTPLLIVHDT